MLLETILILKFNFNFSKSNFRIYKMSDVINQDHKKSTELPIIDYDKPCLVDPFNKKWFENRKLYFKNNQVVFYEEKRGKMKTYLLCECVMSMAMADGRKEMHPGGIAALKRYIFVKCPVEIQKYCFESLKKRNLFY